MGFWGSGDEAIGGFWDIPPLVLVKLLGSRFLGLVICGLSNLQRGFLLSLQCFDSFTALRPSS